MNMATEQEPLRTVVERVWRQVGMDHLSPHRQQEFLAAETERIETLIVEATPDRIQIGETYQQQMGEPADYMTTVGLIQSAQANARQAVLQTELFVHLPRELPDWEDEEPLSAAEAAQLTQIERTQRVSENRHDPQRWRRILDCSEPEPQMRDLAARLWPQPEFAARLTVIGEYLLHTRQEDGKPIPTSRSHPLYRSFTDLLTEEVRGRATPSERYGDR